MAYVLLIYVKKMQLLADWCSISTEHKKKIMWGKTRRWAIMSDFEVVGPGWNANIDWTWSENHSNMKELR